MLIFISPAKTFRKTDQKSVTNPLFKADTLKLMKQLQSLKVEDIKAKMKVSEKIASEAYDYYQNFDRSHQPALFTYFGHQYKNLNPDTFKGNTLFHAQDHLMIMSGLYGLLRPLDAISYYRLEMQDKTTCNLYHFWTPTITSYLLSKHKDEIFINLASDEYGKIIKPLDQTITIEFYIITNNKPKIHSMEAKRMRGLMTRHLLIKQINTLDAIKKIKLEDYTYNTKRSDPKTYIFTKAG